MAKLGTGKHTYELVRDWPKMPKGEALGVVSRVVTDSQDRVYVFQRKDPPVVVFDRDGNYLGCWGIGAVKEAHGLKIVDDVAYTTDRPDSVAMSFTLDGRPLLVLGKRGVHSDTGAVKAWLVERAGGPVQSPHGDDAPPERRHLRDRRLPQLPRAPLHARRPAREVMGHAGQGRGPVPPAAQHRDRRGRQALHRRPRQQAHPDLHAGGRVSRQVDRDGRTERHRARKDGTSYIAEQEDDGKPAYVCVRDKDGNVLTRLETRHIHGIGIDSRGDIYAGLTVDKSVDKFVRVS